MKTKIITHCLLLLLIIVPTKAQDWEFVGLDSMVIKQLYVSGDTIWAGTDARINPNMIAGLYRSTDGGNTWNQIDSALGDGTIVYFYKNLNNSLFYLVKGNGSYNIAGFLYKSTDQGENWEIIQELENIPIDWIGISAFNENEIYARESHFIPAGWFETVYRSIDGGTSWNEITSSFPASSHGRLLSFNLSLIDNTTLYASVFDNFSNTYFFKSTDRGNSWFFISTPPIIPKEIYTDYFITDRIYLIAKPYVSDDGGYSWFEADSGFNTNAYYLSFYQDKMTTKLLYDLRTDGLYSSSNVNFYWSKVEGTENLPIYFGPTGFYEDKNMKNIFIEPVRKELFLGTAEGIYKTSLITIVKNDDNVFFDFSLHQNYPNPFNSITIIEYQLKSSSFVSLKVYDILGTEIATLVNQEQPVGKYQITFNTENIEKSNIVSGMYIYRLSNGTKMISRKMIHLK